MVKLHELGIFKKVGILFHYQTLQKLLLLLRLVTERPIDPLTRVLARAHR